MKNPCLGCIIQIRCRYMCSEAKVKWYELINLMPYNEIYLILKGNKDINSKVISWWFDETINLIENKRKEVKDEH